MLDLREVTAEDAIDAMLTVESLRVPAGSLHTGDRVVYHLNDVYNVATIESVVGSWLPGHPRGMDVTITTDIGHTWSCSHKNRMCLRVSA